MKTTSSETKIDAKNKPVCRPISLNASISRTTPETLTRIAIVIPENIFKSMLTPKTFRIGIAPVKISNAPNINDNILIKSMSITFQIKSPRYKNLFVAF